MTKHVENKGTEMVDCVHNTRNLPENEGKMGGGGRCMALNAMYCKRESKDCPFYKSIKEFKRVPCKIPNSDKYVTGGAVERR